MEEELERIANKLSMNKAHIIGLYHEKMYELRLRGIANNNEQPKYYYEQETLKILERYANIHAQKK